MASSRIDLAPRATSPEIVLSDDLVGIILPRVQAKYHAAAVARPAGTTAISGSLVKISADLRAHRSSKRYRASIKASKLDSGRSVVSYTDEKMGRRRSSPTTQVKKPELSEYKAFIRREQFRLSRAHYRNKQRQHLLELEQTVIQLHDEVNRLIRRAREEASTQSSRTLAVEIFMLLQTSFHSASCMAAANRAFDYRIDQPRAFFFRSSFFAEATVEDLYGVDALMNQLQPYLLYFKDSRIQLQRVWFVAAGVIEATAWMNMTVSELTLQHLVNSPEGS